MRRPLVPDGFSRQDEIEKSCEYDRVAYGLDILPLVFIPWTYGILYFSYYMMNYIVGLLTYSLVPWTRSALLLVLLASPNLEFRSPEFSTRFWSSGNRLRTPRKWKTNYSESRDARRGFEFYHAFQSATLHWRSHVHDFTHDTHSLELLCTTQGIEQHGRDIRSRNTFSQTMGRDKSKPEGRLNKRVSTRIGEC